MRFVYKMQHCEKNLKIPELVTPRNIELVLVTPLTA
nr:MAG TPA: hypothetical protein [Caudoviricetes sp.]